MFIFTCTELPYAEATIVQVSRIASMYVFILRVGQNAYHSMTWLIQQHLSSIKCTHMSDKPGVG